MTLFLFPQRDVVGEIVLEVVKLKALILLPRAYIGSSSFDDTLSILTFLVVINNQLYPKDN